MNDGKLVEEIAADELMERCKQNLKIKVSDVSNAIAILKANKLLDRYDSDEHTITMFDNFDKPAYINELLVQDGIKVEELTASNSGFEDYFIERIGR